MKIPYRVLLLSCLLSSVFLPGHGLSAADLESWTLEDVLAKISEANGGEEAINAVTNARFLGEVDGDKDSYDFVLLKKRPDKMRIHLRFYQKSLERAYNGEIGWTRITNQGYDKVIPIEGDGLAQMGLEADFDGPLVGEVSEGITRRLVGVERIERIDYFIIEVVTPFSTSHHYVDSRTFRELKTYKWNKGDEGEQQKVISYFHDNQRHGQIWVSHRVERVFPDGSKEIVQINDVEINPGLLDRVFDEPEERNPLPSK